MRPILCHKISLNAAMETVAMFKSPFDPTSTADGRPLPLPTLMFLKVANFVMFLVRFRRFFKLVNT